MFIAVPGEGLVEFRDAVIQLLDQFPSADNSLLDSDSVTADSKTFHFDVEKNERGVFIKMTEVGETELDDSVDGCVIVLFHCMQKQQSGYKVHVNIPHSGWTRVGDVFHTFAKKMPCPEQSSATGSDDS